jgi:curli biogenesis system outer membrane secretion channel CsgG
MLVLLLSPSNQQGPTYNEVIVNRKYICGFVRLIAATMLLTGPAFSQTKLRIAVFPFDDRTTSNKDMAIGTKVADLLIAKLTDEGSFTVYDRQYIDRILTEKNRKYDPNYDSATAAKSGLMGTVDMIVSGQIDAFNATASQATSGKFVMKTTETDGAVVLKVTARFISVERGAILMAPSADVEQKGVLSKSDNVAPMITSHLPGARQGYDVNQLHSAPNVDQGLRKLVDQAADQVTRQLAEQVAKEADSVPTRPGSRPAAQPVVAQQESRPAAQETQMACVGMSEGLAYIDKGSQAGIVVGQKYVIQRAVDTGLKNGAGQPIMKHTAVCTLTISDVEADSAAGKCLPSATAHGTGGVPHAGDQVVVAQK